MKSPDLSGLFSFPGGGEETPVCYHAPPEIPAA
jgi:hypothetical protein